MTNQKINVKGTEVMVLKKRDDDYISLTDIAKSKNPDDPRFVVQNWMKTKYTVEFLGIWEGIHNPIFNRVEFDTVKNEAGTNAFVLTPQKWIEKTNAIGIISKSGKHGGGTFAHKDIAFEFASWISAEFKLFLIKEFQRLKEEENERLSLGWDIKRNLAKINYRIHTDAIKEHLIPPHLSVSQINITYASEADVLNKALFGMTAKEWQIANPKKDGNMRDFASVVQLVCLTNLESLNAVLIHKGLPQNERLVTLNEIAIIQMRSLLGSPTIKRIKTN
ncbi:MAG: KilA-N domain-containing protein [Candidatus Gracilibacteria bacterium]